MLVHHLVAEADVDATDDVLYPERVRHGVIQAGRVAALGGPIDPSTHLNLDFPAHRVDAVVVVEALAVGAPARYQDGGFRRAVVGSEHLGRLGRVDVGARRARWLTSLAERRAVVGAR